MARVLIVEDSPAQRQAMKAILEAAGFSVDLVGDGLEALRVFRANPPDLVLTDLQMPKMDGLTLIQALKKDDPFVPVVLITAYGNEEVVVRALRAGAASYVSKHLMERDLISTLRDVLEVAVGKVNRHRILRSLRRAEAYFVLENDSSLVTPLVRRIEEDLATMRFCDPTTLTRIGVALREALVNAIEHGNLELNSELRHDGSDSFERLGQKRRLEPPYCQRSVHFTSLIAPSEARFVVRDEGPGFNPEGVEDPTLPENLCRPSGRGLLLIRTLMDQVSHNSSGNELTMVKRCNTRGNGEPPCPEK